MIKSGHGTVRFAEAASMMFVRKHTSRPVPQVLKFLSHGGWSHIAMEFVKGENLERAWPKMTVKEKRETLVQLREYFNELRALNPPRPGRVEAIDGSPCFDTRLGGLYGPFNDIHSFQDHFGYKYMRENPEQPAGSKEKFDKVYGRSYRTVFSHGDLGLYNIIVHRGRIAAIIDWEFSGWFPEYWEFTSCMDSNWRYEEVRELIKNENVLAAYPDEYECEQCLDAVFIRV